MKNTGYIKAIDTVNTMGNMNCNSSNRFGMLLEGTFSTILFTTSVYLIINSYFSGVKLVALEKI